MKRVLLLAPIALLATSCSGEGNSGRKEADPALVAQVPWINGFVPLTDANNAPIVPATPEYPAIGPNTADPGSRVKFDTEQHRRDACRALEGIELSQWHHDFELLPEVVTATTTYAAGKLGVAQFFSAYDDKTEGAWHAPGDAAWYASVAGERGFIRPTDAMTGMLNDTPLPPWGLPAEQVDNAPSCDGSANNWALHIKGGRFDYYGGGAEHPLSLDCNLGSQAEACAMARDAVGDGRADRVFDASGYDGVAFWGRRGPDGASGLMINLQDKYTSDRLARTDLTTMQPGVGSCKRIKQCYPSCADGAMCQKLKLLDNDTEETTRCVAPGTNAKFAMTEPALLQQLFPPCGMSTCVPASYDPDVDYNNTQCKPYNLTGLEENYYCFGDTPPPAADERCGDGYVSNISLSTDWQFYKLPFDRFQQVGFAKKAPPYDVPQKTLYSIAFLFSVGYTDFYVDNLSFYRNQ
jgi:hypothetical protein